MVPWAWSPLAEQCGRAGWGAWGLVRCLSPGAAHSGGLGPTGTDQVQRGGAAHPHGVRREALAPSPSDALSPGGLAHAMHVDV